MEPQSTMVIPVLDELVLMNLPACWRGCPCVCVGGGGGDPGRGGWGLEHYGRKVVQLN